MAVALGISPLELLDCDEELLEELDRAFAEHEEATRWTPELELLATQAELQHAQLRTFMAAHSKKGAPIPAPLRIPRPGETKSRADGAVVMTPSALASLLAGRSV